MKYEWNNKDSVLVGNNFDIVLRIQNTSRDPRSVGGTINLRSCFYTGVPKAHVKKLEFDRELGPIKGIIQMPVHRDYTHVTTVDHEQ